MGRGEEGAKGVEGPRCWGGVGVVERGRGPYEERGVGKCLMINWGGRIEINNP